jgi:cytochrome P450
MTRKQSTTHKAPASLTAHILKDPLNPFPWYQVLRERHPVYYSPEFHSWFVSRYHDVQRIINDPVQFSSEQSVRRYPLGTPEEEKSVARTLLWADPPHHRQLRSLISQAFTPRTVADLEPRVTEIVHAHLDKVASQGGMDVIKDLANPLPIIVIAELLGIPSSDQRQFKYWSDIIVSPVQQEKKQAVQEMNAYFLTIVNQRRQCPQNDLISALLATQIDDVHLSAAELLNFCRLLLVAGHETSTNLIGNALFTFLENPAVIEELSTDPALLPAAIEEVARYRSPIQRVRRAATRDVEIGHFALKAGSIISPLLGSANRDDSVFAQADVFDIRRTPNRHLAFGHGIHYCIGASLARLETRVTLEALLMRFRDLQGVTNGPLQPIKSAFVYGVRSLPVTFRVV